SAALLRAEACPASMTMWSRLVKRCVDGFHIERIALHLTVGPRRNTLWRSVCCSETCMSFRRVCCLQAMHAPPRLFHVSRPVGLSSNQMLVGTVKHPLGNIAEALLGVGLAKVADWSATMLIDNPARLRSAER